MRSSNIPPSSVLRPPSASEIELERELHLTVVAHGGGDAPRRGRSDVGVRETELRRVEQVARLRTELQLDPIAHDRETPGQ